MPGGQCPLDFIIGIGFLAYIAINPTKPLWTPDLSPFLCFWLYSYIAAVYVVAYCVLTLVYHILTIILSYVILEYTTLSIIIYRYVYCKSTSAACSTIGKVGGDYHIRVGGRYPNRLLIMVTIIKDVYFL